MNSYEQATKVLWLLHGHVITLETITRYTGMIIRRYSAYVTNRNLKKQTSSMCVKRRLKDIREHVGLVSSVSS